MLTYVGLSYGSMIGQTYANLFPGRVRAMLLDGIVDPVDQTTSMEANIGNAVSSADEVFEQFIALCQNAAPGRCALAGHGEPVAQRRREAVRQGAPCPDPGAPRRSTRPARLREPAHLHVHPAPAPARLARIRGEPRRRRRRRRVRPRDRSAGLADARGICRIHHVVGDLVRRRTRPRAVVGMAPGDR